MRRARSGIDSFQADRSPTHMYRTAPLAGLWTHQKGGFYHDGRFATLLDVANHYDTLFNLNLSESRQEGPGRVFEGTLRLGKGGSAIGDIRRRPVGGKSDERTSRLAASGGCQKIAV